MSKKIFSCVCGFIIFIVFQLTGLADAAVPFIQLDKDTYNSNDTISVRVFNADDDISVEIVWEDTGNIVYNSAADNSSVVEIVAPANAGKYVCNVYIGSEKYSKAFTVIGENESLVLTGNMAESDIGNTIGIWLSWTNIGEGALYRIKRTDNIMEETEYLDISTDYFVDTNISPNKIYRYVVYSDYGESNVIIINTSEFVQSQSPSNRNTKCMMLWVGRSKLYNEGKESYIDDNRSVYPIISNDRVIMPIRAVVEGMGGSVSWDGASRTVTLSAWGKTVKIPIDSKIIYVNGAERIYDVAATIKNDRTLVPIRYVEQLGCEVDWNQNKQLVTIRYRGN